jgi:hypothetical protein
MLNFPDAPTIGEVFTGPPSFLWDGIKWMGLPSGSMEVSDDIPLGDGIASTGVLELYQRGDHVHPVDASRAPIVSPSLTGMGADYVVANSVTTGLTPYINNGLVVSQMPDVGGQPSITAYSIDRGWAYSMFLDTNNRLAFGNAYGDGIPASNGSNIDVYGNLYLAHTMLVSRDPTSPMEIATKQYVDLKTMVGDWMPISGAQMRGTYYTAGSAGSLCGNPPPSIELRGNGGDVYMTFHRSGHFACNFGMSSDWNFWMGGWSYGAGVAYRFWTTRDFPTHPSVDTRMAYCTDHWHSYNTGLAENWGGAVVTGATGWRIAPYYDFALRYRYLQTCTSSWWTVGYA